MKCSNETKSNIPDTAISQGDESNGGWKFYSKFFEHFIRTNDLQLQARDPIIELSHNLSVASVTILFNILNFMLNIQVIFFLLQIIHQQQISFLNLFKPTSFSANRNCRQVISNWTILLFLLNINYQIKLHRIQIIYSKSCLLLICLYLKRN